MPTVPSGQHVLGNVISSLLFGFDMTDARAAVVLSMRWLCSPPARLRTILRTGASKSLRTCVCLCSSSEPPQSTNTQLSTLTQPLRYSRATALLSPAFSASGRIGGLSQLAQKSEE